MITLVRAAWQTEYRNPEFVGLSTDGYPLSTNPAVNNGARVYFMDTGKTYEYSEEGDSWFEVPNGGGGGSNYARQISIQATTNKTVNGYQVPVLSDAQLLAIYNAVVAGDSVVITDANGMMHFTGINADIVSDAIFVNFRYFDKMLLEYTEGNVTTFVNFGEIVTTSRDYATTANDHGFYREWSPNAQDKIWVECGMKVTTDASMAGVTVTLPVAFEDTNYHIQAIPADLGNFHICAVPNSANSIVVRATNVSGTALSVGVYIEVKGWKAVD